MQALCKAEDKLIAQMPREKAEMRAELGRATCWDHVFGMIARGTFATDFFPPEYGMFPEPNAGSGELEPERCACCGKEIEPLSLSHLTLSEADMAQHRARVHEQKEAIKQHMLDAHNKNAGRVL